VSRRGVGATARAPNPPARHQAVRPRRSGLAPYYTYRAGAGLARALPGPIAVLVTRGAAAALKWGMRGRRDTVARHLRKIHGDEVSEAFVDQQVERAFASYARYWMEAFRLPGTSPARLEAGMVYDGVDHVERASAAGRGVILAIPHLGAWEWGGAWMAASGYPMTVVVESLEPPELFEWFAGLRRSLGLTVVPLGPQATSGVLQTLHAGGIVGLLSDRDLVGNGVEVSFFGERTRLPGGPATLALRTGAALLTAAVFFEGGGHRGTISAPIPTEREGSLRDDVTRITQEVTHRLEDYIRRAPEQWHVFQPLWPSDSDAAAGPDR
jgi:lauroyl/myristoyl acyltransferase